jgi:hypothetical protein
MDLILPLLILSIPVACVSWTVTHEELFREFHEYCVSRTEKDKSWLSRKFFYLFTCEYCFSHYVTIALLFITHFTLYFNDWRGYVLSFFSVVFIANIYMSLFGKIRIDIKRERKTIEKIEQGL